MDKEYSPFYWHNKALKNPEYQMGGMMDCLREELSFSMPYQNFSTPEPENLTITQDSKIPEWTKRQWGEVQQLKAMVLHLSNKLDKHLDYKRRKDRL